MTTAPVTGRVVAITGGARGIGFATAAALHSAGAKVAIGDIDESAAKDAGAKLGLSISAKLDVTDHDSFATFLDDVERQFGPIDVLVNNAGVFPVGRIADEPDTVTQRTLAINIFGVILGSKLAAKRMRERGTGHIINVASLAAVTATPGVATYCATKFAVLGFTESVRLEYYGTGVNFSSVLPTMINTDMLAGIRPAKGVRKAEPSDVANAIVGLIAKPRPRVAVTRIAGLMAASERFVPRRLAETLRRTSGIHRIFTDDVDDNARHAYELRTRDL